MNTLELISIIFGAGGFGTFIVSSVLFYRSKKRVANADAASAEIKNEMTEVDRLEARLKLRDDKIDTMYVELRTEQNARHKAETRAEILEIKRCDVRGCANRQPPNEY